MNEPTKPKPEPMAVLMFRPQYRPKITSGIKSNTIRPERRRKLKIGQPVSLRVWSGKPYRSPQIEFGRAVIDTVRQIMIEPDAVTLYLPLEKITGAALENFAVKDGFSAWNEMVGFFRETHKSLPFRGSLIVWRGFRAIGPSIQPFRSGQGVRVIKADAMTKGKVGTVGEAQPDGKIRIWFDEQSHGYYWPHEIEPL